MSLPNTVSTDRKFRLYKSISRMRQQKPETTKTTNHFWRKLLLMKPCTRYQAFRERMSFLDLGMPPCNVPVSCLWQRNSWRALSTRHSAWQTSQNYTCAITWWSIRNRRSLSASSVKTMNSHIDNWQPTHATTITQTSHYKWPQQHWRTVHAHT